MTSGREASSSGETTWDRPRPGWTPASTPVVVIEARPETLAARVRALWRYRAFYGFLFKEILTRKSKGTLLGYWWLILRPLIAAAAFIFTFAFVQPLDTGQDVPYPIFFLSGFIPWRLFQSALSFLPRTLMWTQGIMRRTYFPRLLVPLAGFGPTLIEVSILGVVFVAAAGFTWWTTGVLPLRVGWQMLWLVPCLVAAALLALALGMVLGIVALFFRDVVFSISYVAQMFMFVTPVLYPVTAVPESYRWLLYTLNPMAQIVEVSRWALTGSGHFSPMFMTIGFAMILLLFTASLTFFVRAEAYLGDQL